MATEAPPAGPRPAPRHRGLQALRLAAAIIVGLPLMAVVVPNAWVAIATRGRATTSLGSIPSRQVAIVPGSRVFDGRPMPNLRDRLEAARALYERGHVRAILVSGNETAEAPEVTVMRTWLLSHGVPASDIWTDEAGTRTRETMQHAAGVHGITDAVICTQTLFMPRSLYLARAAGIDAVGIALPTTLSRSPRPVGLEALKTTLAVGESILGASTLRSYRSNGARAAVAVR